MKKSVIKKTLLMVMLLTFCVGFAAQAANLTNHTFYNKLILNGVISPTEHSKYVGQSVCMTLMDGDNLLYIGEEIVKEDGRYEFVIDLEDGNTGNLNFNIRIGNEDAKNTLLSAVTKSSKLVPVKVNVKLEDSNARITADLKEIDLLCEKYSVIVGVYSGKTLKSVKIYNEESAEIAEVSGKLFFDATISDVNRDDTVKVFVWQDVVENIPLAKSNQQVAGDKTFQDGDVVAVVGDSITHDYGYPMQLELFYMTRYPDREVTFYNKGINGQGAKRIYERLDWDILTENPNKVVLMYGVNDLWYHYYDTEAGHNVKLQNSYTDTGKLVDDILNKNIEPILVTPTVYDEREIVTDGTAEYVGTNSWLDKLCVKLKELAVEKDVKLFDVNAVTNEITHREANKDIQYVITGGDRIHPNPWHGSLIIAYSFLKEQYVAKVDISSDATVSAYNCDVSDLEVSGNRVSYTYFPKAEPMSQNGGYATALNVLPELTDTMNNEIVKVDGLDTSKTYMLSLDGVEAGSYTGAEFAEGVNIATLSSNPNLLRANNVYTELIKKREAENKLREIAITIAYNNGEYSIYSETGYAEFLEAFKTNMHYGKYTKFWDNIQEVENIQNTKKNAWTAAREYAQPVSYNVVITEK